MSHGGVRCDQKRGEAGGDNGGRDDIASRRALTVEQRAQRQGEHQAADEDGL
jgi:hypothetical protein